MRSQPTSIFARPDFCHCYRPELQKLRRLRLLKRAGIVAGGISRRTDQQSISASSDVSSLDEEEFLARRTK